MICVKSLAERQAKIKQNSTADIIMVETPADLRYNPVSEAYDGNKDGIQE